ncbi:3'-5' exonuclease, partial [Salmonella enterica]|uniref:3'-5' exonuclease n=1 Tax=Salmonella enterica TaxID=28901 RepID=UPI0015958B2B
VVLSTLHGSKGLEWNKVIIMSCNADQIPSKRSVGEEAREEERRLLYVGFTRAEKQLFVMWHGDPSFFLRECSEEKIK